MKYFLLLVSALFVLSCSSSKTFSDFDYSFSRSGGYDPIYENFLIKGNKAHYSLEKGGTKTTQDFTLTRDEVAHLDQVLTQNNFRLIEEDYKKVYDNIATSIYVKKGKNAARKSDAGFIMPRDQERWKNVVDAFQNLLDAKLKRKS